MFAIRRWERAGGWTEYLLSLRLFPGSIYLKGFGWWALGLPGQWYPYTLWWPHSPAQTCCVPQVNKNRSLPGTQDRAFIHPCIYSGISRIRSLPFLQEAQWRFKQTHGKINISTQADTCCDKDLFLVPWEPGEVPAQRRMAKPSRKCWHEVHGWGGAAERSGKENNASKVETLANCRWISMPGSKLCQPDEKQDWRGRQWPMHKNLVPSTRKAPSSGCVRGSGYVCATHSPPSLL